MREIWKSVEDYEGRYEVSSQGRVKSLVRPRVKEDRALNPYKDSRGYLRVTFRVDGKARSFKVHRLVAQAFIGPIPVGMEVNHLDSNKKNNSISNLEIVTSQQNMDHAVKNKLNAFGERNGFAKLTDSDVVDIRQYLSEGHTQRIIALLFGVTRANVSCIKTGKTWSHVA